MNQIVVLTKDEIMQLFSDCLDAKLCSLISEKNYRKNEHPDDQLLTTSQACLLLHVSKPTLIKYKKEGKA